MGYLLILLAKEGFMPMVIKDDYSYEALSHYLVVF